jgi:hypothetical protein
MPARYERTVYQTGECEVDLGRRELRVRGFLSPVGARPHDQLRGHLADFVTAYNFARLKTLKGLTPYEFICRAWTKEPNRFSLDPIHQMPGLNK